MKVSKQYIQEQFDRMVGDMLKEMFIDEKGPKKSKSQEKVAFIDDDGDGKDDRKKEKKNMAAASKRARVIQWLKDDSVNCAEIMRKLWHPASKKEDAARSYFYKCRDGELNDSGVAYSFSDKDINKLYSIKNNTI